MAAASPIALPSRLVFRLSLRSLLGKRRALALLPLNLLPIIAAIARLLQNDPSPNQYARLVGQVFLPFVVALVALALASSSFADERDDSTILYLTQTPLPRMAIVSAKVLATTLATLGVCAPGLLAVIFVGSQSGRSGVTWLLLAVALTALAYSAFFGWLALKMRRAVITGIAYIVFWEGAIASFAGSANRLSISAYGRVVAREGHPDGRWLILPPVSAVTAAITLLVATALGLWVGSRRLERMELP